MLFIWFGFLFLGRSAGSEGSCTSLTLANRTGRTHCWAQFWIAPESRLCVDRTLWNQLIRRNAEQSFCPSYPEHYKIKKLAFSDVSTGQKRFYIHERANLSLFKNTPNASSLFNLKIRFERLREKLSNRLRPNDSLGLFRSLLLHELPETSPLPFLRKLGLVHLMNPTGIHLYAAMRVWAFLILIVLRGMQIPTAPSKTISQITSFSLTAFLWCLSGARLGMLRPWLLILMRQSSTYFGFRLKKGMPLLLALSMEALISQFEIHPPGVTSGRLMYALAVGGGLLWSKSLSHLHLSLAVGSFLWVALLDIWEYHSLSLLTPLLSLLSLPLICTAIYPALLMILGLSPWINPSFLLAKLDTLTHWILGIFAQICFLPFNFWLITPESVVAGLLISFILIFIRLKTDHEIALGFLLAFILGVIRLSFFSPTLPKIRISSMRATRVEQLDIGQGDSAWIGGESNGLIDCGSEKALTESTWLEGLAQRRVRSLDWVFLTHLDEDHVGGLLRLAQVIPIHCVVTSREEISSPRGVRFENELKKKGLTVSTHPASCIPYPVLLPSPILKKKGRRRKAGANENMSAILVPLESGGFFLAAGDARSEDEERLGRWVSENAAQNQAPRILKINHHGSKTSSTLNFLNTVRPSVAWISSGMGNSYHHPHPEVLARLKSLGIPVKRTDKNGTIKWNTQKRGWIDSYFRPI